MNWKLTLGWLFISFVDKIGDKTAILRKYDMSTKTTKILFCQNNSVLFWKRKDTFKKQI